MSTSQSLPGRLLQCVDFYGRQFLRFEFLHDVVEGELVYLKRAGSKGLEQDGFSQDVRAIKHSTSSWNNLSAAAMDGIGSKLTVNQSVPNPSDSFLANHTLFCCPIECSLRTIFNLRHIGTRWRGEAEPIDQ